MAINKKCGKSYLKERRKELHLTQKEIAASLGITSQAYGNYENSYRKIPITSLRQISTILQVDIGELVLRLTEEEN